MKVWLLIEYDWETQDVRGAYECKEDAERVLALIQAAAEKHRAYPDTAHEYERNLGVEEADWYPAGDLSLQLRESWECRLYVRDGLVGERSTRARLYLSADPGSDTPVTTTTTEMVRRGAWNDSHWATRVTSMGRTKEVAEVAALAAVASARKVGTT